MSVHNNEMTTLTQVLERLRMRKQDNEFKMTEAGFCTGSKKCYGVDELTIIKVYRFEGDSDPADSSVLYLIEANDGLIGYTIDAYGVYSNHDDDGYDDFLKKLNVAERDEQQIFAD